MKHPTIKELKEKERMLRAELTCVQDDIYEYEKQIITPKLEKKYKGKWFKTRNNYSCPETDGDYWWTYLRVDDIKNGTDCNVTQFQTDKYGDFSVNTKCVPAYLIKEYTKITEREAMDAFGKELEVVMTKVAVTD